MKKKQKATKRTEFKRLRVLHRGRFLRTVAKGHWEWVERVNTTGAVVIAAVTKKKELVLIEQFRIPLGRPVIELPAGLIGDEAGCEQEDRIAAAQRELLEETGYEADHFEFCTEGPSSAGLANEVYAILVARNARRVGAGGGVAREEIRVHVVPIDKVHAWIEARRKEGVMVDPKVYAGLYFIKRSR